MSVILAGLLVASASGAAFVGGWLARKRRDAEEAASSAKDGGVKDGQRAHEGADDESAQGQGTRRAASSPDATKPSGSRSIPPSKEASLEGFPCQLGDVIMRITGEEAWLAGALVLDEQVPVAALFVAPDAKQDVIVYARPAPRTTLYWLAPLDPGAVLVGGEPPSSVEHQGIRFERARRLPLRPRRLGVGAPDMGDTVIVAEYGSPGAERLVVLKSTTGAVRAYRGVELDAASYEVIASGHSTLG